MSRHPARIIAVMGASGSGKSAAIKQHLARHRPPRLLIWDPLQEYADYGVPVRSMHQALDVMATRRGRAKQRFGIVFWPHPRAKGTWPQAFSFFCRLALAAGNCTLVVEELALVTQPHRAPEGWSEACLTGRHRGLEIIAASQRPASVDKDFFSNASKVRTGRLNYAADVRTMAQVLDVTADEIRALQPLEWIERDMQTGAITRGRLEFSDERHASRARKRA